MSPRVPSLRLRVLRVLIISSSLGIAHSWNPKVKSRCGSVELASKKVSTSIGPEGRRRSVLSRFIEAAFVFGASALARPLGSRAFCGENPEYWEHYLAWNEGLVPFKGKNDIFIRVVGDESKEKVSKGEFDVEYNCR